MHYHRLTLRHGSAFLAYLLISYAILPAVAPPPKQKASWPPEELSSQAPNVKVIGGTLTWIIPESKSPSPADNPVTTPQLQHPLPGTQQSPATLRISDDVPAFLASGTAESPRPRSNLDSHVAGSSQRPATSMPVTASPGINPPPHSSGSAPPSAFQSTTVWSGARTCSLWRQWTHDVSPWQEGGTLLWQQIPGCKEEDIHLIAD